MPPVSSTVRSRRSVASSASQMRIELVTTIRSAIGASASTRRQVVVPAVRPMAEPGRTIAAAASAMACFSSICSVDLAVKPGSTAVACVEGERGPAVHLVHQPLAGEQVEVAPDRHVADAELRREVAHPRRPWRCTWAAINSRRRRARMRELPVRPFAACTRGLRASDPGSSMPRNIIEYAPPEVNRFDHICPLIRPIAVCSWSKPAPLLDFVRRGVKVRRSSAIRRPTPLGGNSHMSRTTPRRSVAPATPQSPIGPFSRRQLLAGAGTVLGAGLLLGGAGSTIVSAAGSAQPRVRWAVRPERSRGVGDGHVRQQLLRPRPQGGVPGDD